MKGFLDRLFGRAEPPAEVKAAREELDRLSSQQPSLAGPAALLRDALAVLWDGPVEPAPAMTREQAQAKLADKVPLLRGEDPGLNSAPLTRRWQALSAVVEHHRADGAARLIRDASLRVEELARLVLDGRTDAIRAMAQTRGLDPELLGMILRLTLFPVLSAWATTLSGVREGIAWAEGYCPVCGSWPLIAELRGLEQIRWLRCGLCAAGWEAPRLLCPFCGERDHRRLGFLQVEGEAAWRVTTCESCRGYLKTRTTLGPLSPPGLLAADVASLPLDLAAADRDYNVPS